MVSKDANEHIAQLERTDLRPLVERIPGTDIRGSSWHSAGGWQFGLCTRLLFFPGKLKLFEEWGTGLRFSRAPGWNVRRRSR